MGPQVERISRGASVDDGPTPEEDFGRWFQRQRSLRGISVYFVAARTRMTPERVTRIESGDEPLPSDGRGRAMARGLALAIGADPQEAAAHLVGDRVPASRRLPSLPVPWLVWGGRACVALLAGLSAWLLVGWLVGPADDTSSELVYRSDYVDKLLEPGDD